MYLRIVVARIDGHCPVYKTGDVFELKDGYRLTAEKPLCMHGLAALMPFYNALRFIDPAAIGLADKEDPSRACVQCPDAVDCTGGGRVVFRINRIEGEL